MIKRSKKLFFVVGLIAIIAVYSCYNIYFNAIDVGRIPVRNSYLYKLISILLVYAIGTGILRKMGVGWMMLVWHLVHISIILVLGGIGIYYWQTGTIAPALKNIAATLHDFLISPVLFVSMGIINYKFIRYKTG